MSVKLKGTVKWFDTTKGFGFLLVDDDMGDVLLHANVLRNFGRGSVVEGSTVEFEVQDTDKGRQVSIIHSLNVPNETTEGLEESEEFGIPDVSGVEQSQHVLNGLINQRGSASQTFISRMKTSFSTWRSLGISVFLICKLEKL